jgi:hypothetical protein
VSELEVARAKIITIIGGTNVPSSEVRQGILKMLGNPALMEERYIQNVRYGLILAVDVLDDMIEGLDAER